MSPPDTTDTSAWVNRLALAHDRTLPALRQYSAYYEGKQPLTYMHPDILKEVQDRIAPVIIAWPALAVDTVEERLDVEGFRLPKGDADADLWRVWQENGLDEESQLGHVDALAMGRSYVTVGTNEDDDDTPLVTVESPLEVWAEIDPRTRDVRAALRRWGDHDPLDTSPQQNYATLYLPDVTVWYEWSTAGAWEEQDRDEHGLGVVPVVPLVNRARLSDRYGCSDLAPIIPLSDAACKLATDMMVAAEFVALPLRALFGIGPKDLEDEEGNPIAPLQAIYGRLLTLTGVPGGEVKPHQFDAASLANFHDSLNQLAKMVASIAGLPPHYLGYATDNPASADAIRSAEARLVKRAERKQRALGGSWEKVGRLVRRMQNGGEEDPTLRRLETIWRDASTPTRAQAADAAVKLHQEGIVPTKQTRIDLGYTAPELERMEEEDAKAAEQDPVGMIARSLPPETLNGPTAGGPAAQPAAVGNGRGGERRSRQAVGAGQPARG